MSPVLGGSRGDFRRQRWNFCLHIFLSVLSASLLLLYSSAGFVIIVVWTCVSVGALACLGVFGEVP